MKFNECSANLKKFLKETAKLITDENNTAFSTVPFCKTLPIVTSVLPKICFKLSKILQRQETEILELLVKKFQCQAHMLLPLVEFCFTRCLTYVYL